MIITIIISLYLLIGVIAAFYFVNKLNKSVENRENNIENEKNIEEAVDTLENTYNLMGFADYKKFTYLIFIGITIAWLPIYIIGKSQNNK
jgi:tetrahydromethanopterin S-methyltransferase subunit B